MIRFIDLQDQIIDDCFEFAFYDTITNAFISICSEETWEYWDEFQEIYEYAKEKEPLNKFFNLYPLERFEGVYPENRQRRSK